MVSFPTQYQCLVGYIVAFEVLEILAEEGFCTGCKQHQPQLVASFIGLQKQN